MQWINEVDLKAWAQRIDARSYLPDMVADLILATIGDFTRFRFPGGEVAELRGWDGSLETPTEIECVPAGKSKWEFGTGAGAAKASSDYKKRTDNTPAEEMAENTLVLVNLEPWDTPRQNLETWEQERRTEKKWRDVRYLDAVSLVHWLDAHPAVAAKYARDVLQRAPKAEALSTDEFWDFYSSRYKPSLTEKVVIGDRQEKADEVIRHLQGSPQAMLLGAETALEVVAFAVAAIRTAPPEVRRTLETRTMIVESQAAARFLTGKKNLSFITKDDGDRASGVLSQYGPTLSAATGAQARNLPRLARSSANGMVDGLMEMGCAREDAYELAHRCGRSLTILQRLIPNQPYDEPEWVRHATTLKPAFLAGGWSSSQQLDKSALVGLSGAADYDALEQLLLPFTTHQDPPFDKVQSHWKVRAPVDAFIFYAGLIVERDLDRLKKVAIEVFSHVADAPSRDQKFSLSYVSPADYSVELREGLALTLLIVATMSDIGGLHLTHKTPQEFVDSVITELPELGKSHRSLIGLSHQTALLAEAAPNPFLRALESMLEGEPSEVTALFANVDDGLFGPSGAHFRVLWALEVLAWDPKYLNRVAVILGKLAALDPEPDSNGSNRPLNSLREILLSWSPNTNAGLSQRIACLDAVIEQCPSIAWPLLTKLFPRHHESSTPTQKPLLRDSKPLFVEELTYGIVWDAQHAVVDHAIAHASQSSSRVVALVEAVSAFHPKDRAKVLSFLDDFMNNRESEDRPVVWKALSNEVARHEFYASSDWAMSAEERDAIQDLLARYRPDDPFIDERRLFDDWMPMIGRYDPNTIDRPERARGEALERVFAARGVAGILELSKAVALPHLIGHSLEYVAMTREQLLELLIGAVSGAAPGDLALYVSAMGSKHHCEWWEVELRQQVIPRMQSAEDIARLFLGWKLNSHTWDYIESIGREIYDQYWILIPGLPDEGPVSELDIAVEEFRRHGRSIDVLAAAHRRLSEIGTDVLVVLLQEAVPQVANAKHLGGGTMLAFYVDAVFAEVTDRIEADPGLVARLEFAYFPLLEHSKRKLVLFQRLERDPNLFVEMLSYVFRSSNAKDPTEPTPAERNRAHVAYRLLSDFKTVPGSEDGSGDGQFLRWWVDGARAAAAQAGLVAIGDQYIGKLLAHAKIADSLAWPPEDVCAVIEDCASDDLDVGFATECFNKRGVYSKAIHEGGKQERLLAKQYETWSAARNKYVRTSAVLERVMKSWDAQAKSEDIRAELDKSHR